MPLRKVTDEYCEEHQDLGAKCCVRNCTAPRQIGHRTCHMEAHRKEEKRRQDRGRKTGRRAAEKRAREEAEEAEDGGVGAGGEDEGRREERASIKGVFSRKWTHNEQLTVRPCGVVIGRATFFSAESMTGVKVSRNPIQVRHP